MKIVNTQMFEYTANAPRTNDQKLPIDVWKVDDDGRERVQNVKIKTKKNKRKLCSHLLKNLKKEEEKKINAP